MWSFFKKAKKVFEDPPEPPIYRYTATINIVDRNGQSYSIKCSGRDRLIWAMGDWFVFPAGFEKETENKIKCLAREGFMCKDGEFIFARDIASISVTATEKTQIVD